MKTISRSSFLVRVAYSGNVPSTISLCELISRFAVCGAKSVFAWFVWKILTVVGIVAVCTIGVVIGFLGGYRPAFINLWKYRHSTGKTYSPFAEFPLPKFRGKRILPIVPIAIIGIWWILTHISLTDVFQPSIAPDVAMVSKWILGVGIAGITCVLLYQLDSWRAFLLYLKTRWVNKVCISLKVVE